ncbi:MAG: hypothetical protein Unbinned3138contig1001_14 [Prokaryotic dsDNA virus sp.]|nr:MAG: hypothetical protein Unbinned3138contig1001_14 [Prokaryotic dsDNA virus sp.]|tara:strand:+ start:10029 stop:10892 length:864 start_codon:yes stop_codon:yes gene_type:complete
MKITSFSKDSHEISFDVPRAGWEKWFLLSSDRHHDNAHTNWEFEKKHLDEALERDAGILDFGDLFCAMQGKYDFRSDTSQCRPEHQRGRYLDSLVETATDFYHPYKSNWLFMSPGNHETSILKRHETDLTERFAEQLGRSKNGNPVVGAYCGYIRLKPMRAKKQSAGSLVLYYHHGYGGGGPVTRGVIQTNRMGVYLPDAHIVASGHTHDSWVMPVSRSRLSPNGRPYIDRQTHVRIPGYKDEFSGGDGWHNHRGGPPKPQGAYWLRVFHYLKGSADCIDYEILEAR